MNSPFNTYIIGAILGCIFGLLVSSYICINHIREEIQPALNNSIVNMESLKRDCEKDLPRTEECVLVYKFIPVKTKEEK